MSRLQERSLDEIVALAKSPWCSASHGHVPSVMQLSAIDELARRALSGSAGGAAPVPGQVIGTVEIDLDARRTRFVPGGSAPSHDVEHEAMAADLRASEYVMIGGRLQEKEIQEAWDKTRVGAWKLKLGPLVPLDFVRNLERLIVERGGSPGTTAEAKDNG